MSGRCRGLPCDGCRHGGAGAAVAPLRAWVIPAPRPDEDRPAVEAGRPRVLRVLPGGQRDTYNPHARREQRR